MTEQSVTFEATVESGGGTTTGIPVEEEVLRRLGRGTRFPVVVSIGGFAYRTTVTPYRGRIMLSLSAENRAGAGVAAGDTVTVTLAPDDAPRVTEVPDDLRQAIDAHPGAQTFFAGLAPGQQKAYVTWVSEAKKADTRSARIDKAVQMLTAGLRR